MKFTRYCWTTLSVKDRKFLENLSISAPWDGLFSPHLAVIDTLIEEIEQLDDRIEERAEEESETGLLMTILGIAHYSALVIYAELGEIDRFDTAK